MSYMFADSLRAGSGSGSGKLSANLYDIYHCCVYNEKLLVMDRGTLRNMYSFYSKNKFKKLVHLVGFVIRSKFHLIICHGGTQGRVCREGATVSLISLLDGGK